MKLYELAKELNIKAFKLRNWLEEEHDLKYSIPSELNIQAVELAQAKFKSDDSKEDKVDYPAFGIYKRSDNTWCVVEFKFNDMSGNAEVVKVYDDDGMLKYKSSAVLTLEGLLYSSAIYQDE